jgi:hypothetical protein
VKAEATLLSHDGAGHQLKINKKTGPDTASLLYQSNWSGRAEMGLAGSDDWSIKVSPDGSGWTEALRITAATGMLSGAAVQGSPLDAGEGKLLKAGTKVLAGITSGNISEATGSAIQGFNSDPAGPHALTLSTSDQFGGLWAVKRAEGRAHQIAQTLTGQLFHRHETASGFAAWRRVFDTMNLVGTVNQSAGVPTGAVFQYGSNGNGDYVRFADGTQLCWRVASADLAIDTAYFGGYRSTVQGRNAAASFLSAPVAVATVRNQSAFGVEITETSTTGASIRWLSISSQASAPREAFVCFIGRWY